MNEVASFVLGMLFFSIAAAFAIGLTALAVGIWVVVISMIRDERRR